MRRMDKAWLAAMIGRTLADSAKEGVTDPAIAAAFIAVNYKLVTGMLNDENDQLGAALTAFDLIPIDEEPAPVLPSGEDYRSWLYLIIGNALTSFVDHYEDREFSKAVAAWAGQHAHLLHPIEAMGDADEESKARILAALPHFDKLLKVMQ